VANFDESVYRENRVRDCVHGFIHFSNAEKKIIGLKEFQRLRNIKQLAFTYYVYPGAMHSRFEHSLGVMELATQAVRHLLNRNYRVVETGLKRVGLSVQRMVDCLRLAALLHDVGHLPFSHGAEGVLPQGKKHEDVSIAIISSLKSKIDQWYFEGATDVVVQLIQKEPVVPELSFMKNILSGQIDVDRMDYLLRDSLHCGVKYGTFDHERLLETLLVIDSDTGGIGLAIDSGGVQALEALILARYYMYTQVLFHRTRRIYDIYLHKYLEERNVKFPNLTDIAKIDDLNWTIEMRRVAEQVDEPGNQWARCIVKREHHSSVYETNAFAGTPDRVLCNKIYNSLKAEFRDHDFIIDSNAKGTIHKFVRPDEEEMGDFFYVKTKQGQYKLITEVSKIIRDMPKGFHVIRIYAKKNSPRQQDGDDPVPQRVRDEVKKRAVELEGRGLV